MLHLKAKCNLNLFTENFDPFEELRVWNRQLVETLQQSPAAQCHFIGRARDTTNSGETLEALELEHYPGMCESEIARLAEAAAGLHQAMAVLVQHRIGLVMPGQFIVLVAVAADRRGQAQRCCQELMEEIKHKAPFWKREWSAGVGHWLESNTAY